MNFPIASHVSTLPSKIPIVSIHFAYLCLFLCAVSARIPPTVQLNIPRLIITIIHYPPTEADDSRRCRPRPTTPDFAMDEKGVRDMSPVRLGRPSRRIPTMVSLALVVIGLYTYFSIPTLAQIAADRWQEPLQPALALVPFEAHIMSKCPDAKDCLKYMVLPAMQRSVRVSGC